MVSLDATADVLDESVQSFGSGRPVRLDSSESPDPEQQQNGNSDDLSKTWTYGMSQAFSLHQRMASDPVTNYPLKVSAHSNQRCLYTWKYVRQLTHCVLTNAQSRFVLIVLDVALIPPCPTRHTSQSLYLCSSRSNAQGKPRALEGLRAGSKGPSKV